MNIAHRIKPGLVSVTFRKLSPRSIVEHTTQAGLAGIEWGGDVHVPHGDLSLAREVGAMTRDAGLAVAAYGSYYETAESETAGLSFGRVLDTALALGAPLIRVWAGKLGSADADAAYRRRVENESRRIAAEAAGAGIALAFEFHGGTLADTADSTAALLAATADAGMRCYWQPLAGWTQDECLASIDRLSQHLANLHVYHWLDTYERRPLAEGSGQWLSYLRAAAKAPYATDLPRWAMLEFLRDDDPARLAEDSSTLIRLLAQVDSKKERS